MNLKDSSFSTFVPHLLFAAYYYLVSPYFLEFILGEHNIFQSILILIVLLSETWAVRFYAPIAERIDNTPTGFRIREIVLFIFVIVIRVALIVSAVNVIVISKFSGGTENDYIGWCIMLVFIKEVITVLRMVKPIKKTYGIKRNFLLPEFIILNFSVLFLVGLEHLFSEGFGSGRNEAIPDFILNFIFFFLYFILYSAISFVHIYPPLKMAKYRWEKINIFLSISLSVLIVLYKIL